MPQLRQWFRQWFGIHTAGRTQAVYHRLCPYGPYFKHLLDCDVKLQTPGWPYSQRWLPVRCLHSAQPQLPEAACARMPRPPPVTFTGPAPALLLPPPARVLLPLLLRLFSSSFLRGSQCSSTMQPVCLAKNFTMFSNTYSLCFGGGAVLPLQDASARLRNSST